jgi:uncharacterized protein (TIGR02231 family)
MALAVGAGPREIVFGDLPADLDQDSLRAAGRGTAQAAISGMEVREIQLGAPPEARTRELETRIRSLEDREKEAGAEIDSLHIAQKMVRTALAATGNVLGTSLASRSFDPKLWLGPLQLAETQDVRLSKAILALGRRQRDLAAERGLLARQLAALRGFQTRAAREARVFVDVAQAGKLDVELTYDVPRAAWSPTFDVTLQADLSHAKLAYFAQVTQQTGEDWQNARIALSSGRPDLGAAAPDIEQWVVDIAPEISRRSDDARFGAGAGAGGLGAAMPASTPAQKSARAEASEPEDAPQAELPMGTLDAGARTMGTSVQFEAARPVTLPADGRPHQVPIGDRTVAATASYRVVPRLSPHAYLTAEVVNTTPWPLLAGQLRAHLGGDFVGTTELPDDVAPAATFSVAFGADRQIKVARTVLSRTSGERGFLVNKRRRAEYGYKIALHNQKDVPVKLEILEPVPVSHREDVVVTLSGAARTALREGEPGAVTWTVNLPPGGRKEVSWGYAVEWPQDMRIAGLE